MDFVATGTITSVSFDVNGDGTVDQTLTFTNIPEGATIRTMIHDGFSITDGHPTFQNVYTDPVDANQFARELIKPVFRKGWTLPELP